MPAPVAMVPQPPAPKPATVRVGRLDTANAIRRELCRLYRDGRQGRVDPSDASKLGSLLALACRLVESSDLERRLDELEASLPR